MSAYFTAGMPVSDELLTALAHLPTKSLPAVVEPGFIAGLEDREFMRLAVMLARKSFQEGGCPIGAVVIDSATRAILGKGHNTLVQDNDPYNHGETAAIRDAGRIDFSRTTLFTTLSPCQICASLIAMRGFSRVVIGDVTNASGTESMLRDHGIEVKILEDPLGIELYARFRTENPARDLEDWKGLAAVAHSKSVLGSPADLP
jgi:cytosine deaminase